ncbi:MAG: hypothetical protein HKN93_03790 [Acidimicrobiia bacterium]|nr:hypothetical protein [Acidimicrobiia bacterium]
MTTPRRQNGMRRSIAVLATLALLLAACGADNLGADDNAADDAASGGATSTTTSTTQPAAGAPNDSRVPEDATLEPETAQPVEREEPTDPEKTETAPPPDPTPEPADPPSQLDLAVADLASRQSVDTAEITVVSTEDVVWRDGSLGCPEPGTAYTQALVSNGYLIKLRVGTEVHEYHGAGDTPPFYCENPTEPYRGDPGDA